ncbi:hypothetical protein [Millisia brevis]|nr:hypothetical protein [Millisia brevis]
MTTVDSPGPLVGYIRNGKRGVELWKALTEMSERLLLPAVDVGSGLVTAP